MFQTIKSWPVLILGPKVTPPGHVSIQVAQLNTQASNLRSHLSSWVTQDTASVKSMKSHFRQALVDIINIIKISAARVFFALFDSFNIQR